jgi:hypothetical protein
MVLPFPSSAGLDLITRLAMPFSSPKLLLVGLVVLLAWEFPPQAVAQAPRASQIPTASLQQMTRNAGYIFTGKVIAVEREAATRPNTVGTMRITFRVEHAIRGVHRGQMLMIREWAGRWESGDRYRPGEAMLLFLYPPSKLGLTSAVGGASGHFALDSNGRIVLDEDRIAALALEPSREAVWREKGRISSHEFADAIRHISEE